MFGLDGLKPLFFGGDNDSKDNSATAGMFSKEILVIQLGKWSVVVSRRVASIVLIALSTVFLYFSWFHDFGGNQDGSSSGNQSIQLAASWTEFIEECGSSVVISNNVKATEIFKRKYKNNFVSWSGYFIEKKQVNGFSFIENSHAWNILVKMEPSETELQPDIVLSGKRWYKFIVHQNVDELNKIENIACLKIFHLEPAFIVYFKLTLINPFF